MATTQLAGVEHDVLERECAECGGALEADTERAEAVCADCGLVATTGDIDHGPDWGITDAHEAPNERAYVGDPNRQDDGMGSVPPRFESDGVESVAQISHRNSIARSRCSKTKPQNKEYLTGEVRRIGTELDLPTSIRRQAQNAARAWHGGEDLFGRDLDAVAGAAVLFASRATRAGVGADDIAPVARSGTPGEIRQAAHTLADAIGVGLRPPTPEARLDRIIGAAGFDVREPVRRAALELLDDQQSTRSPTGLAAAALYLAGGGRGRTRGRWTQEDLATVAGVSPTTVRVCAAELDPDYNGNGGGNGGGS